MVSKAKKPKRLTGDARRTSIIQAARVVFTAQGYSGARVKAIADEANTHEAIIYKHFSSKQELFEAAIVDPIDYYIHNHEHISPTLATEVTADDRRRLLKAAAIRYLKELYPILPLLSAALSRSENENSDFYSRRISPLIAYWAQWNRSSFPPGTRGAQMDSEFLIKIAVGGGIFLIFDAIFVGNSPDFETLGANIADWILPLYDKVD